MFNIMLLNVVYTNAINLKMLFLLVCFNLSYLNLKLSDIFMDFIKGLPCSVGKDVIFVVVDRLSKHSHFITLCHLYSAKEIVKLFMDNVSFLYVMLPLLSMMEISSSLAPFGILFLTCKSLNCAWALHITLNQMDKQRLLIVS